eukprot:4602497-Amphidinium_carterae.1
MEALMKAESDEKWHLWSLQTPTQRVHDWQLRSASTLKLCLRRQYYRQDYMPTRRAWLAVWSHVQTLHDTQPGSAAAVQRHLDTTLVRVVQDIDSANSCSEFKQ